MKFFWVLQEDVEYCQVISIVFTRRDKLPFLSEVKERNCEVHTPGIPHIIKWCLKQKRMWNTVTLINFFCSVSRAKKRQTHGWLNSECFQPFKRRKRQILMCSSILRIQFILKERSELAKNSADFQEFPNGIKVIYINSIFSFCFWVIVRSKLL